jgi:hypothetical protein
MNKKDNVCTALLCGVFVQLLWPWRKNSTVLFLVIGLDAALNNINVRIFETEMQKEILIILQTN